MISINGEYYKNNNNNNDNNKIERYGRRSEYEKRMKRPVFLVGGSKTQQNSDKLGRL